MNPGELKNRITIQSYVEIEENNVTKGDWTNYKTIWCKANNLYGKEYWEAKKYNAENTVEFTIRYNACPDISVKNRIIFKGKVFNIKSVDNVLYKNETIKIKAVEVM